MMLRIVALTDEKFFYQVKIYGEWKQFKKPIREFIMMMFKLFPELVKQVRKYNFDNVYSIANWLYNYGEEVEPCDPYIFYYKVSEVN